MLEFRTDSHAHIIHGLADASIKKNNDWLLVPNTTGIRITI
jgi:hypothetical protein